MSFRSYNKQFKPLSTALNETARSIGAKRGFHDQTLLRHWAEFVGEDIAALCHPREVRAGRGRGSTLILDCVSAYASELQMRSEEIRAKLNAKIGAEAITKIELRHQDIDFKKPKQTPNSKPRKNNPIPDDLEQNLDKTQNDELRAALISCSRNFYNKGEK